MKSLAEYIAESIQMPKKLPGTPMQFADLQKTGDFIAKKLKCGIDAYSLKD